MGADPSFKVIGAAYPYVASRLLTDPAPQLREAFIELLFKVIIVAECLFGINQY